MWGARFTYRGHPTLGELMPNGELQQSIVHSREGHKLWSLSSSAGAICLDITGRHHQTAVHPVCSRKATLISGYFLAHTEESTAPSHLFFFFFLLPLLQLLRRREWTDPQVCRFLMAEAQGRSSGRGDEAEPEKTQGRIVWLGQKFMNYIFTVEGTNRTVALGLGFLRWLTPCPDARLSVIMLYYKWLHENMLGCCGILF